MPTRILHHCKGHGYLGHLDRSQRHQIERARSINQELSSTENPFRKLPLVMLLNQYHQLNHHQHQQGDLQQSSQSTKPNNQPPNETALQLLHTGTYFGESIGLSCRANSPATVGLLLLDLTFPHSQLLPHLLLPGAKTNCDLRFHCQSNHINPAWQAGIPQINKNQTTRSQPNQSKSKHNQQNLPTLTFSPTKLKIVPIFPQTSARNKQKDGYSVNQKQDHTTTNQ